MNDQVTKISVPVENPEPAPFLLPTAYLGLLNKFTAASTNDARYYLHGVCVEFDGEYVNMIATDGHKLTVIRITNNPELDTEDWGENPSQAPESLEQYIIPGDKIRQYWGSYSSKAAKECIAVSPIAGSDKGEARLQVADTAVVPIDGHYPNWRRVVFADRTGATNATDWLGEAIKDSAGAIDSELIPCKRGGLMSVRRELLAKQSVGLNSDYMAKVMTQHHKLRAVTMYRAGRNPTVSVTMHTPNEPVFIVSSGVEKMGVHDHPTGENIGEWALKYTATSLVMPVRL